MPGVARDFDGGTDKVSSAFVLNTAVPFSISWWEYEDAQTNTYGGPLGFGTDTAEGLAIFRTIAGSYDNIAFGNNATLAQGLCSTTLSAVTGAWHCHLLVFLGGTRTLVANWRYFRDGVEGALGNNPGVSSIDNLTRIGCASDSNSGTYFDGAICHVAVWGGVAFGLIEAAALFGQGPGRGLRPDRLYGMNALRTGGAWWPLYGGGSVEPELAGGRTGYPTGTRLRMGSFRPVPDPTLDRLLVPLSIPILAHSTGNAYTLACAQGSYALTGQTTSLLRGRLLGATQGSYTYTGQTVGLLYGRKVQPTAGSYVLSGQDVGLKQGRVLAVAQGSYVYTGQTVLPEWTRTPLAVSQGSYALSGQDVTLRLGKSLACTQGSYALTGQDVGLLFGRALAATQGSYALTGEDVALKWARTALVATQGSYVLTGEDVGLLVGRALGCTTGTYAISGQTVGLTVGRRLAATQGSYALTGQDVTFPWTHVLGVAQGTYSLTGEDVNFVYTPTGAFTLLCGVGTYTLSGQAVGLLAARRMPATQGSYSLSGQAVGLLVSRRLLTAQGAYIYTGEATGLLWAHLLSAAQGAYAYTGQSIGLFVGRRLAAAQGTYTYTGEPVVFPRVYVLGAVVGTYTYTGISVGLAHHASGQDYEPPLSLDRQDEGSLGVARVDSGHPDITRVDDAVYLTRIS